MTAISLNNATSALLTIRPTVDDIIFLQLISNLSDEIGNVALAVERESFAKAQAKSKPKPKKRLGTAAGKKKSK